MKDITAWATKDIQEEARNEVFLLLARAVRSLAVFADNGSALLPQKLDILMMHAWVAKLEFSFDGAGPLLGLLSLVAPNGDSVEVLRMDSILIANQTSAEEKLRPASILDLSVKIAADVAKLALQGEKICSKEIDRLLAKGAVCTFQFLVSSAAPLSCSLLLQESNSIPKEILTLDAPFHCEPFFSHDSILSAPLYGRLPDCKNSCVCEESGGRAAVLYLSCFAGDVPARPDGRLTRFPCEHQGITPLTGIGVFSSRSNCLAHHTRGRLLSCRAVVRYGCQCAAAKLSRAPIRPSTFVRTYSLLHKQLAISS